jgi:hypothetical protein
MERGTKGERLEAHSKECGHKKSFSSTGRNQYFILQPGYQLTLAGSDDDDTVGLEITVLSKTTMVGEVESKMFSSAVKRQSPASTCVPPLTLNL